MDALMSVPLKCNCPPGCVCGSKEVKTWKHRLCQEKSRINELGNVYCEGHEQRNGRCSPYFLQHASFKCKKSNTKEKFRTASQFLMALAQGLQAAEFTLDDDQIVEFATKLNIQVMTRWNK